ncbi:MAG: 50S ribosomal protein L25/general stress protein Ctc [Desulfobacterales bacterium]|nr:50S ribosomal protein L25/general stress protein Ctc [Desulfobacterales bacterium]
METFQLEASQRKSTGKGQARALRRQGLIPAVLYGPKIESMLLTISDFDLGKIYKESGGENVILNLVIKNGGTQNKTAMIKDMQTAPVTRQCLHVDFYEISLDEEITLKVPVELTGKSIGVERGGFLQLVRRGLEVSCLPADIPDKIEVDVSDLDIGDSVHVEDISLGERLTLLFDTNFTVVTLVAPVVEEEEVPEEELEEAEEAPDEEAKTAEEGADK